MCFHSTIFKILVSESYQARSYLLPWVVLASGLFSTGQILSIRLTTEMRIVELLQIKSVTAIFASLLNIAGACFFGLNGVVASFLLFLLCYFFWVFKKHFD